MGTETGIDWTDHTWNPWQGCRKVSAGYKNCYMYPDKKRFPQDTAEIGRYIIVKGSVPNLRRNIFV